jgi:hypothetical protein
LVDKDRGLGDDDGARRDRQAGKNGDQDDGLDP